MKVCGNCNEAKTLDQFSPRTRATDGLDYSCKTCNNKKGREWRSENKEKMTDANLRTKYGISLEDKREMLEDQDWCCAICLKGLPLIGRDSCVDHCHETNEVRGILCKNCNNALGLFADNPDSLTRAANYIKG